MQLNELETIWTASDAEFQRVADRVDARLKQSTKQVEKDTEDIKKKVAGVGTELQKALEPPRDSRGRFTSGFKKDVDGVVTEAGRLKAVQKETEKLYRDHMSAVERLINRVPGGQRVTQFKALADDIKLASGAAKEGEGSLTALGGASGAALIGIGALAVGAAAVGAGVVKSTFDFVEFASSIHDIGQESGLTAPTLSTIAAYARLAGTDVRGAASAVEIYLKNVAEAAHGNEAMSKTFQRFGIDAKQAIKNPDLAARQLFDTLAKIPNAADRLDAGFKLAGKSGKVLANIALEMNGNFAQAQAAAHEWGVVLSEDDVKAADKFGDAWDILKMKAEGVIFDIGRGALPELQKGIDGVSGSLDDSHKNWEEFGRNAGTILRGLIWLAQELAAAVAGNQFENSKFLDSVVDKIAGPHTKSFDAGNSEAIDPKTMRPVNPGAARDDFDVKGKGKGGGGNSAANKAAKAFLEAARIDLREAESIYKEGNSIAKRGLELNLTDFAHYSQIIEGLEAARYEKQKEFFDKERTAAGGDKGKLKDIEQREREAAREHDDRVAQQEQAQYNQRLDRQAKFAESAARIQEESNRVAELDIANHLARGETTYEKAMQARLKQAAALAVKQGEVLRVALEKSLGKDAKALSETIDTVINDAANGVDEEKLQEGFDELLKKAVNKDAVQEALDAIKEFFLKRKQAWQQGTSDVQAAQEDDLNNMQSYAQRLADIAQSIQDINFEIEGSRVKALEDNHLDGGAGIEARRALDVAMEQARNQKRNAGLDAERRRIDGTEQNEKKRAALLKQIDAQIEAEERLHQQKLIDIDREAAEVRRQQLVDIANDIAGILSTGLDHFSEDWSSVWHSMLQEALSVLKQIGAELLKMSLEGLFTGQTKGSSAGGLIGFFANAIGGALLGSAFGGGAHSLGGGLASGSGGSGVGPFNASGIPGFASGGDFLPGWKVVGERGPELEYSGSPGHVFNADDTKKLLGGGETVNDNRKIFNIMLPPNRVASTYTSRRGSREVAEDMLRYLR